MLKKKSESGRSMVEMLGVLAIIGVLSIGGIAGYTLSMRRYRANQVLDAVNKYALIAYASCQKALIDGEITRIIDCGGDPDEGSDYIIPNVKDVNVGSPADIAGWGSMYISQSSGVDILTLPILFTDTEVCKAAKSIIGSKNQTSCTGTGSDYLHINIKQN